MAHDKEQKKSTRHLSLNHQALRPSASAKKNFSFDLAGLEILLDFLLFL